MDYVPVMAAEIWLQDMPLLVVFEAEAILYGKGEKKQRMNVCQLNKTHTSIPQQRYLISTDVRC